MSCIAPTREIGAGRGVDVCGGLGSGIFVGLWFGYGVFCHAQLSESANWKMCDE